MIPTLQIQQKLSGVDRTLDGGRRGAGEYDRIRASILDEAAIVHLLINYKCSLIIPITVFSLPSKICRYFLL